MAPELSQNWYLLQVKPNQHKIANRNLKQQGFATFSPLVETTRRTGNRFANKPGLLFPGYMFVGFDPGTGPWRKINGTIGVSRLVSFGETLHPVPFHLICGLIQRCDPEGNLLPPKQLQPGDEVAVTNGPFTKFVAIVEKIATTQRVWVLLDYMGQMTRIQFDTGTLAKAP